MILRPLSAAPLPPTRQKRQKWISRLLRLGTLPLLLLTAPAQAGEAGPRALPATPDLVLGSRSFQVSQGEVSVTVKNQGKAPSAATLLRLTQRPPLAAAEQSEETFPHHRLLSDEQGLVIWPEPHADYFLLKVRWQGRRPGTSFRGRLRVTDAEGNTLKPAARLPRGKLPVSSLPRNRAGWSVFKAATGRTQAGFDLRFRPSPPPAFLTLDDFSISGAFNLRQIFMGSWWITRYLRAPASQPAPAHQGEAGGGSNDAAGQIRISLQDVRLAHVSLPSWATGGIWLEEPLPSLDPGSQATVRFSLAALPRRLFAQVDPENRVVETLEGNNTAAWKSRPEAAMVSLHTHASLSEGTASVDRQMDLLSRSGYDTVFWTEHDWRVSGHGLPARYGFETEPSTETWSTVTRRLDPGLAASAGPTAQRATQGTHALRLTGRRPAAGRGGSRQASFTFRAYRGTQVRSLAQDLSIAFDLFPDVTHPFDSSFTVELELSDQVHVQRWLSYEIETLPDAARVAQTVLPPPAGGQPGRATIVPGQWTRIVIPVSHHARLLFPEGVDNNVSSLDVGLKIWKGRATWDLDNLVMETALAGSPLLALEQGWTDAYPALASHVLNEISYYVPHFNAFVAQPFLLDYDGLSGEKAAAEAVARTHRQDGAISLNHPMGFGLSYPAALIESQMENRLMGADLLEVGYRYRGGADLAVHLKFWDRALSAGIIASGIGVTDAHGPGRGNGFARDENNFATWLQADPMSRDSLIDALLAGRTVFGDPLLFTGRLDLSVDGRLSPGAVLLGPAAV
ncbi:MAG: hypothetical protein ACE5ID_04965, partial [Acidobacteriota bacterium]